METYCIRCTCTCDLYVIIFSTGDLCCIHFGNGEGSMYGYEEPCCTNVVQKHVQIDIHILLLH
jgi:hypothetical protein